MISPTASLAGSPTDPSPTDTGIDAPASGFDILLAAHADTHTERDAPAKDTCDDRPDSNHSGSAGSTDSTGSTEDPKSKTDSAVDAEALAAQLAAQAAPSVPLIPEPAAPPAGDQLDSAAVLEAAAGATEPDPPAPATDPTDPPPVLDAAPATVNPDLTALLVATASNDAAVPGIASVPIPSFLESESASAHADQSAPASSPAPISPPPGPVPSDPVRPDRVHTAPADTGSVGYAPVSGPAAVTSNPAAANAEAAATAATVAPPPPAEQLVSILSPLRTTPNGSYTLRLELKPVELGRVELRVEMRDGVLHASIHADHDTSAQLVRASLNELRDQLAAEGVRTGTLTVSDNALGSSGRDGGARQTNGDTGRRGRANDPQLTDEPDRPLPGDLAQSIDSDTTSLLDVRV